ncbi:MAG: tyrosine-type recombinase/integrase [Bacillota bacterium]
MKFITFNKGSYCEFKAYVIIHTLIDSFGRIDEVLSIRQSDIDFESKSVIFSKTKSGKIRIIPMSMKTLQLIEELIKVGN